MPYISTKTNKALTYAEKEALKARLGADIAIIPGKSESWLMLGFEDGLTMAFAGDMTTPAAMIEVDIFGSTTKAAYDRLTAAITDGVSEILGIKKDRIYVKYREVETWGWNGKNF